MMNSVACAICESVRLLLRAEIALVATSICEIAQAMKLESEAEMMTAAEEEVDADETDEAEGDCFAVPDADAADETRDDD